MAKRKATFDNNDDDHKEGEEQQRPVYIETSLNTHLVLNVYPSDTVTTLKQKFLLEHADAYPDIGEIQVTAFKVKQKGSYFRLANSMLVKTAFYGVVKPWFLYADAVVSQRACVNQNLAIIPHKGQPTPFASFKPGELEIEVNNKEDRFGTNPNNTENMLQLKDMSAKTSLSRKKKKSRVQNCDNEDENDDVQSSSLLGSQISPVDDDQDKAFGSGSKSMSGSELQKDLHLNSKGNEGPATESNVKNVGDGTELKDSVDKESFQSGSPAKKKRKVVNDNVQELSLLGAKSLLSDPNRAASKPETLVNKFDGEDVQKSRLVDSNAMPSEVLKTSKASRKRKMEERYVTSEVPSSEASKKETLKDTEHHALDASAIATDAAAEAEAKSFQSLDMPLGVVGNNHLPEGTTASLAEHADSENRNENSGLAHGNGVKKAKEVDGDGTRKTHHTTSSEVPDKLEDSVAPLEGENTVRDSEPDNVTIAEGIKATNETVELASAAKKKKAKKGKNSLADRPDFMSIENNYQNVGNEGACGEITPQAEEAEARNENVGLRSTAKKKVKKGKNSVAEKPELTNLESDNQDVHDDIVPSGPAEDQNKSGLTNEGNSGENAPQIEGTEAANENKELGSTTNKLKKGKSSVAERSELTSKGDSHQDVCNDIDSSGPAEDQKKDGPMNAPETDVTEATNENVELGTTSKKKKVKKGKNFVAEKPDLTSMENDHQDVNMDTVLNRPAEDLNKDGLKDGDHIGEDARETKSMNPTELASPAKKKKVKKGKNFVAEKPDLTSMENDHQDVNNDILSNTPVEDLKKDGRKNADHIGEDAPQTEGTKAMNQTVELASPAKKKKAKKGKNFVPEKPDLTSMENDHQDVNNTPVEDLKKDGLKNTDHIGEDAPVTEGTKAMNQTVELAGTAKKKKAKKGNNSVAEKPELTSMENDHQDVNYDTVSSKLVEDLDKDGLKNEGDVGEDVPQIEGAKAINQTVELASTVKKKKAKKGKNSVAEKPDLASMENDHQDVGNEGGGKDIAPQAEEAEARNENVGLGSMPKKKKLKKVKSSFAEKPTASSMGNTTDVATDICSDGHAEADKGECVAHTDSKTATVSCQKDGWEADDDNVQQTVPQLLQPAERNKAGENREIKSDKPKWIQKKQPLSAKDPLESPPGQHFGDKTRGMDGPRMANGDLPSNSDNNDGKQEMELGEDRHEKNIDFPPPKVSAGLAEGRKLDKPRASKQKAKKLDAASSVDTSASGQSMISSKTRLRNKRTSQDVTQLQNYEQETENMKHTEPPQVNKPEENVESRSDKTKKMTPKKQTAPNPPQLSVKQHLEDKVGEMAAPKLVEVDPLTKSNINDATHQREVSLGEGLHEELNIISPAGDSSAEMKSPNKPQASKQEAKKVDIPLPMDTSSNGPSLSKLKKSKITSHDVTGLQKDCTEQKHNQSMPEPSAELPVSSKEQMVTRARRAELVATVQNQKVGAKKTAVVSASIHGHNKRSDASSVLSSSSDRRTHQGTKAKELHKKPDGSHVDSRKSRDKKMGVVNASAQRKGLSATSGAIFGDESGSSSSGGAAMDYSVRWRHQETKSKELHKKPDENNVDKRRSSDKKMGGVSASTQGKGSLGTSGAIFGDESSTSSSDRENMDDSGSSTRTPSDNSSSDYSEGENKGDVMTPEHDSLKRGGAKNNQNSTTPGGNKLTFESILRSSSRFRKARQMASQSQFDDSESQPGEFVPDSQP